MRFTTGGWRGDSGKRVVRKRGGVISAKGGGRMLLEGKKRRRQRVQEGGEKRTAGKIKTFRFCLQGKEDQE